MEEARRWKLVAQDLYVMCVYICLCGQKYSREKDEWGWGVLAQMKLCQLLRLGVLRGQDEDKTVFAIMVYEEKQAVVKI